MRVAAQWNEYANSSEGLEIRFKDHSTACINKSSTVLVVNVAYILFSRVR